MTRNNAENCRTPWFIAGMYLAIALASAVIIPFGDDPLDGIFLVLLAMPWVILTGAIIDSLAIDSMLINVALLAAGIAINAWILWMLGHWLFCRKR